MTDKTTSLPKVAFLNADGSIVINRGSANGVKIGENYLIFGIGPEVIDPETGDSLGSLELVRGRAKVRHVQERMATLVSTEEILKGGSKKTIRRDNNTGGFRYFFNTDPVEEIEEAPQRIMVKLKDPRIGDLARPI